MDSEKKTGTRVNLWLAGLGGLAIGAIAVLLAGTGVVPMGRDKAGVETIVHDYIIAHPEVLTEAMQRLRDREVAGVVNANRALIETPFPGASAGAANADVTLVEFFDYACGYCRQTVADIDRLLAEDKKLRVVFRELPILGPPSEVAARASLAAAGQGKFLAFHRALYAGGRPTEAGIAAALTKAGVDPARASRDGGTAPITREIGTNIEMTRALGISGTPAFVVGGRVLSGAVGYAALKAAIAEARAR